jgi:hypothetical protein
MKATNILLMICSLSSSAFSQSPALAPAPPELPAEIQPQLQPPIQPQMPPESPPKAQPPSSAIRAQPKSENGFTYLCGGVGSDESAYMKRAAKNYDLMSTFATRDGSYIADVNIAISDKSGKATLQTTCSGPIMLVKFPRAGTYSIRAEAGGSVQTKTAQVPAKGSTRSIVFVWPAS